MATSGLRLLFQLSILFGLLAIAANARPGRQFYPCNTLIFVSSSSTTSFPLEQNPNFASEGASVPVFGRRSVTLFFTRSRLIDAQPTFFSNRPQVIVDRASIDEDKRPMGFDFFPSVSDSFRDRAKDILSVVGSLLLGVGCGALTASTLYLVWSLFTPNRFEFRDYDEEDSDEEDFSPKKMGYFKVPEAEAPVAALPAKEVA